MQREQISECFSIGKKNKECNKLLQEKEREWILEKSTHESLDTRKLQPYLEYEINTRKAVMR